MSFCSCLFTSHVNTCLVVGVHDEY
uniref:Uncharacterized protein n=1 Tax=Anguilla anguilla TaxID=7936 RepID=A0A0E9WRB1_ANGAN